MISIVGNDSSSHPCPCDRYKNCTLSDESATACCIPEISLEPEIKIANESIDEEMSEKDRIKTIFQCLEMIRFNKNVTGITKITTTCIIL